MRLDHIILHSWKVARRTSAAYECLILAHEDSLGAAGRPVRTVEANNNLVTIVEGPHPFPFRTRKLSPPTPMVLPFGGRVGRRQVFLFSRPAMPKVRGSITKLVRRPHCSAPAYPVFCVDRANPLMTTLNDSLHIIRSWHIILKKRYSCSP